MPTNGGINRFFLQNKERCETFIAIFIIIVFEKSLNSIWIMFLFLVHIFHIEQKK